MFFPNDDPWEFLNNDGSFKYVNFNMITGWIALTQIPNTLITYAKLNLSANDIPYNIINIPNNTITGLKIIWLPIEKIWNINNNALSYNVNTFLNGLGNFVFIDTATNIFYTASTIPLNTIIFPNADNTEF